MAAKGILSVRFSQDAKDDSGCVNCAHVDKPESNLGTMTDKKKDFHRNQTKWTNWSWTEVSMLIAVKKQNKTRLSQTQITALSLELITAAQPNAVFP